MNDFYELNENKYSLNKGYWINKTEVSEKAEEHTHDFIELVYTFHGNAVHIINGEKFPVRKGDMLFLNYKCTHAIEPHGKLEYADIMFKLDYVDHSLKNSENAFSLLETSNFSEFESMINEDNSIVHFSAHERAQIEQLIEWTLREQEKPQTGANFMIRSMLNLILTMVFRKMEISLSDQFPINADMLSYIKSNCAEQISLKDIALKNYYTPSYLSSQFKAYTGVTFMKYLMDCRIEKAMRLLRESNYSIETILGECGFSNRTRFFRMFKEKTGMTPLRYRKEKKI